MKNWSEFEKHKAITLREQGKTYNEISQAMGKTIPAVAGFLQKFNIKPIKPIKPLPPIHGRGYSENSKQFRDAMADRPLPINYKTCSIPIINKITLYYLDRLKNVQGTWFLDNKRILVGALINRYLEDKNLQGAKEHCN